MTIDLDKTAAIVQAIEPTPGVWMGPNHERLTELIAAAPELIELARMGAAYLAEPFPGGESRDVCSFCNRAGGKRLIVGFTGNICDRCVARAAEALAAIPAPAPRGVVAIAANRDEP